MTRCPHCKRKAKWSEWSYCCALGRSKASFWECIQKETNTIRAGKFLWTAEPVIGIAPPLPDKTPEERECSLAHETMIYICLHCGEAVS
jgi:hypothetical protein